MEEAHMRHDTNPTTTDAGGLLLDDEMEHREASAALTRFREQSFFFDECLDLLTALRDDVDGKAVFERSGHQREWLEDLGHQRRVLDEMTNVLLNWETIRE
jgi:hypothetical protein